MSTQQAMLLHEGTTIFLTALHSKLYDYLPHLSSPQNHVAAFCGLQVLLSASASGCHCAQHLLLVSVLSERYVSSGYSRKIMKWHRVSTIQFHTFATIASISSSCSFLHLFSAWVGFYACFQVPSWVHVKLLPDLHKLELFLEVCQYLYG